MESKLEQNSKGSKGNIYSKGVKGELHPNLWNLAFSNKLLLKFHHVLFLKYQKIDNRSWDIYLLYHTEICFYAFFNN